MSELKTNLQEILQDKNTNLKPENLKQGVTCLGVEGTYTGDSINDYISLPEGETAITIAGCIKQIPQLDTSAVNSMSNMFNNCTALTTIPLLNTSNVTSMSFMFNGCAALTNDSLNNILAMLTNATSYTGTKTLKYIGLSETQATTCTTLSNWSACEAAGWTTGY